MNQQVAFIFSTFITILMFCIIGRSLLTWFPIGQNHPVVRILNQVTDPLLQPVRRIMPQTGMIDFSGMIVIFVLFLMLRVIERVTVE